MFRFAQRSVQTPSGIEWRIGRRWLSRGLPRWRRVRVGAAEREAAGEAAWWSLADSGGPEGLAVGLAVFVGVLVVAVILIPLLLFGIELIIAGFVIALGILGRGLLGRPWVVEAVPRGLVANSVQSPFPPSPAGQRQVVLDPRCGLPAT